MMTFSSVLFALAVFVWFAERILILKIATERCLLKIERITSPQPRSSVMKFLLSIVLLVIAVPAFAQEKLPAPAKTKREVTTAADGSIHWKDANGHHCCYGKDVVDKFGFAALCCVIDDGYSGQTATPIAPMTSDCATGSCGTSGAVQYYYAEPVYQRRGLFGGFRGSSGNCANGSCR